jgi:IS4 transposase
MILDPVFERLVTKSPVTVMVRGIMENVLSAKAIDRLFLSRARSGYSRKLLFSQMVDLMGMVVARIQPQVNAAFKANKEELRANIDCVYDKLQRIEPQVCAGLVEYAATALAEVIDAMPNGKLPSMFRGYHTKILDGKHLNGTQRRIKSLRKFSAVPLPGQLLVVLDTERMLACDVVPCEDAYTQERGLIENILPAVKPGELWIEDRNFCTTQFVFGVAERSAFFLVRYHKTNLFIEFQSPWKRIERLEDSTIEEGTWRIKDPARPTPTMTVRVIRIKLDKPTRFGETEIILVTNLPAHVTALEVASGYRHRWTLETAFGEISATLHAEINTMGYPKAALFGFSVALVIYNILSTVKAALRSAHGTNLIQEKLSAYYLANEVRTKWEGLDLALDESDWEEKFRGLTRIELSDWLVETAARVNLSLYPKSKRGPKKKVVRIPFGRHRHVSTARILAEHAKVKPKAPS